MTKRRVVLGLVAACAVLALSSAFGSSAHAQEAGNCTPGYEGGNFMTVNPTTVVPGGTFTVTGGCFSPGTTVEVTVNGVVVGTLVASPGGTISGSFGVPTGTALGSAVIGLSGTGLDGAPLTLTATVTVVAPGTVTTIGTGTLPTTGSSTTIPLAGVAAALIMLGGFVLMATRRNRSTSTTSV